MKIKILIFSLIGIILSIFVWQVYTYNKYDGNLIVNISNQSNIDTVKIELFIDGEKQSSDLYTNEEFHNYKRSVFNTKIRNHKLLLKLKNKAVSKEIEVNTMFVTWLYIDFYEENLNPSFVVRKSYKSMLIQ